jgi:ketosteroid isomerase-like protein
MTSNVEAVRSLHAGEGGTLVRDRLFGLLADDTVRGPEGVRGWLETLNEHMDYERFELLEIHGDAETVVEIVNASGRAAASRRPFESELVRIWTFHADKARLVRSYYDTAAYERSFLGALEER